MKRKKQGSILFLVEISIRSKGAEGFQRATGKPFGRLRRGETLQNRKEQGTPFPLPSTRNLFLVGGFARLRADEVLSPRGKVPKGRRGRPKGACGVAAPGPPVAKLQCAASLAGARPAGFTSVPGRATVAFGAADPSPGSSVPVYPWSVGKRPPLQDYLAAVRTPAPGPCKVRVRCGTRLVAGPRPNQMACPIWLLSVERQEEVPLMRCFSVFA